MIAHLRTWPGWNAANTALARKLYVDEGLSASVVARLIGASSRNAVIGRMHRIGAMLGHDVRKARSAPHSTPRVKGPRYKPERATPKALAMPQDTTTKPKPLLDLRSRDCRWIVSGDGADSLFCAGERIDGSSYCARHFHASRGATPPKLRKTA